MTYEEMLTTFDTAENESAKAFHKLDQAIVGIIVSMTFLLAAVALLWTGTVWPSIAASVLCWLVYVAAKEQNAEGMAHHETAMALYDRINGSDEKGRPEGRPFERNQRE